MKAAPAAPAPWFDMRELTDKLEYKSHGFVGDLESERKHPSLELAVMLADYFGVSADQLAWDELEVG